VSVQTEGILGSLVQEYKFYILQSDEHPSPFKLFPSSQFSPINELVCPSPQYKANLQTDIWFSTFVHFHLSSTLQLFEQPSITVVFPLSHYSPNDDCKILSPQLQWQIEG
jgi:hypothetical protein